MYEGQVETEQSLQGAGETHGRGVGVCCNSTTDEYEGQVETEQSLQGAGETRRRGVGLCCSSTADEYEGQAETEQSLQGTGETHMGGGWGYVVTLLLMSMRDRLRQSRDEGRGVGVCCNSRAPMDISTVCIEGITRGK